MMQQSPLSSNNPSSNANNIVLVGTGNMIPIGMQQQPQSLSQPPPSQQQPQDQQPSQILQQNLERLFSLSPIEVKDEYEEKMCRCYLMVQNQMTGKSEHQIHEELTRTCRENMNVCDEISLGLIVSMLLDLHNNCHRLFIPIILSNRDGASQLCYHLNFILNEKFPRLHDHARQRLVLLCKELLRSPIQTIENIFHSLLRNIVSGDTSPRNIQLAESILDVLIECRCSYDSNIILLQYVLFKYLRLIADHVTPASRNLFNKEVKFCHELLRDRFQDFLPIGRDLIRLLQQIGRVPEFDQLWKTMLINPASLSPKFNLVSVMKTRTHRRFIRLLITVDIEKKLGFLVGSVRLGSQRRYQDWFQRQYLNNADNTQMLRTDLIRFVCNYIHPSNEVIASDLVPRWAVIGWLLTGCPNATTTAWSRLALFYDWLMFDMNDDVNNNQIMDLEPGLLVMFFSLKHYTALTNALLDFLCRITTEFYPPLSPQIKQGIRNAFVYQVEKRVIQNLSFVFDPVRIELNVRQLLSKTFPELMEYSDPVALGHPQMTMLGPGPQLTGNQNANSNIVVVSNGHYFTPTNLPQHQQITSSAETVIGCGGGGGNAESAATNNCSTSSPSSICSSSTTCSTVTNATSSESGCYTYHIYNAEHLNTNNTIIKTNTTSMSSSTCLMGTSTTATTMSASSSTVLHHSASRCISSTSGGGVAGGSGVSITPQQVLMVTQSSNPTNQTATVLVPYSNNNNTKPNLNPILTNIKSINVKQISSAATSGSTSSTVAIVQPSPLSSSSMPSSSTPMIVGDYNNSSSPSSVVTATNNQTQIVQMVHMAPPTIPTLNPISTTMATTNTGAPSTTNVIMSKFSDDEDDSLDGSGGSGNHNNSGSNQINSSSSTTSSNSLTNKIKHQTTLKKMKKSNSFGQTSTDPTTGNIYNKPTQQTGNKPASAHHVMINKNGGAGSLTINSVSTPPPASNHQQNNNPEYIANILNSSVMNNNSNSGNINNVSMNPTSGIQASQSSSPHIVSVIMSGGANNTTSTQISSTVNSPQSTSTPTSVSSSSTSPHAHHLNKNDLHHPHHHHQTMFSHHQNVIDNNTHQLNQQATTTMSFNGNNNVTGGGVPQTPTVKTEVVTIIDADDSNDSTSGSDQLPLFISSSPFQSGSSLDQNYNTNGASAYSAFSDRLANIHNQIIEPRSYTLTANELREQIDQITNNQIKNLVIKFSESRDKQTQCDLMEKLVKQLVDYQNDDDNDDDEVHFVPNLTMVLSSIMDEDMSQNRFPNLYSMNQDNQSSSSSVSMLMNWLYPNETLIQESIEGPLFVMFKQWVVLVKRKVRHQDKEDSLDDEKDEETLKRKYCQTEGEVFEEIEDGGDEDDEEDMADYDPEKDAPVFKQVLAELAANNTRVGFLLLHYLVVTKNTFHRMICYLELLDYMNKDHMSTLFNDLEMCHYQDGFMFFHMLPQVMRTMGKKLLSHANIKLFELILAYGDFIAVQYLCKLIQKYKFQLVKKDDLSSIAYKTCNLDCIQQQLFWELIDAHDFPMEAYLPLISKLEDKECNLMVLNHIKQVFKRVDPTKEYLRLLTNRDHNKLGDCFVVPVLLHWAKRHKVKLADVIGAYVSSMISSPNKRNKRTLNNVSKTQMNKLANVEQLLFYLDELRKAFGNIADKRFDDFFSQEFINVILDQLKQICTGQQKTKYAQLFANVPDDDNNNDSSSSQNSTGSNYSSKSSSSLAPKKRKQPSSSSNNNNNKDSATESDSSDDDVPTQRTMKTNLRNKKRKQLGLDSD